MTHIKTFRERCKEHPDHQSGMVTNSMIQARLREEVDELRERLDEAELGAARYEYVRRLSVPQFQHLFAESMRGRPFDSLVDAARLSDSASGG